MITANEITAPGTPRPSPRAWIRVAVAMFAVGWGANQFSPMLIVYRHELNLSAAAVAGLFAIYATTLIPGLLIGGPASDRLGRRPVVVPFVVLSPVATLLLVLGPHNLVVIAAGRALAGLCSGVVFGSATAWVQELSHPGDRPGAGAHRAALALSAGFGLGPVTAAMLAQWVADPLRVPYLPHLAIGAVAAAAVLRVPDTTTSRRLREARRWPPAAVRTRRFWLAVAPAAPLVFGSVSVAIVVLPEDVTSARSLSASFAGLMTALAFSAGLGVQPLAKRLGASNGLVAGLCSAAVGTGIGIAAAHGENRVLAGVAAVFLGLAYGMCLVCGLQQAGLDRAGQFADAAERGAVVACYYALAYLGFAVPYLAAGLGALAGKAGALAIMSASATLLALWTAGVTSGDG